MKQFSLIDFGTVEIPTDFKIKVRGTSNEYKYLKRITKKRLEGSNNFELWFSINLAINDNLIRSNLSFDECLSLAYLLKKAEESNTELKETIRIWREDESKLSSVQNFYINNIIIIYYKLLCHVLRYFSYIHINLDRLTSFIGCYRPRLLKQSSDCVEIRDENDSKLMKQLTLKTGLNLINKLNFGFNIAIFVNSSIPRVQIWF